MQNSLDLIAFTLISTSGSQLPTVCLLSLLLSPGLVHSPGITSPSGPPLRLISFLILLVSISKPHISARLIGCLGLVNTALFVGTRRILPDTASLPQFTTPRTKSMSESEAKFGVTPFSVEPRQSHEGEGEEEQKTEPAPAYSVEADEEDLGPPVLPRQETYTVTLSEGIVVPTLGFSYPNQRSKP